MFSTIQICKYHEQLIGDNWLHSCRETEENTTELEYSSIIEDQLRILLLDARKCEHGLCDK